MRDADFDSFLEQQYDVGAAEEEIARHTPQWDSNSHGHAVRRVAAIPRTRNNLHLGLSVHRVIGHNRLVPDATLLPTATA